MRLIGIDSLRVGDALGEALRMQDGRVILPANAVLTEAHMKRLTNFRITGVYVQDDIFDDVVIVPALKDETKSFALNTLSDIYKAVDKGKPPSDTGFRKCAAQIAGDVLSIIREPVNLFNMYSVDDPRCLHGVNVATIVAALAIANGCPSDVIEDYTLAGLLHDIKLPNMMKDNTYEHSEQAFEMLKSARAVSARVYMPIYMHHEKFDGTGAPKKLRGEGINEGARLIAIADMYDSLVYGYGGYKVMTPHKAVEYLHMQADLSLDPELLKLFNTSIAIYPTGATVLLSNGLRAIVTRQNEQMPTRPCIRLCMPRKEECLEFNLLTNRTVFIDGVEL